jgi:hypothetical protein
MNPLMLAASSRNSPAATRSRLDILLRMSGRDPLTVPGRPGTPSVIMSPDNRSCTQIRLGAGTPTTRPRLRNHGDRSEVYMS